MNEIIKLKVFQLEEFPQDKYNIKILEKAKVETLSYSIESIDTKDINRSNTFGLFKSKTTVMKDEDIISKINKMDMLAIVKKLYNNFKMVNKSNYNVDAEEEKIKVKFLSDKLLLMKKFKHKKKIDIKEEITEEEKQDLFSLITKKENRTLFLSRLNKIRTFGNFQFQKTQFDDVIKILLIMLDQILTEKDYHSFNLCMVLTQTFYLNENGEKSYMYKYIKSHKIFQSEEMWRKSIDFFIEEEENKYETIIKNLSIKKNMNKINEMIFAQLLSIANNMIEFDLDINLAEKIILDSFKKHKINEESIKIILNIIEEKKNKINDNKNEETNNINENNKVKEEEKKDNNLGKDDAKEEIESKKENIESKNKEDNNINEIKNENKNNEEKIEK